MIVILSFPLILEIDPITYTVNNQIPKIERLTAREAITKWSKYYRVDRTIAMKIAAVESGLNCMAENPDTTASGLFQFVDGTFIYAQTLLRHRHDLTLKTDCSENAQLAIYLMSRGELYHWEASRWDWDENYTVPTILPAEQVLPNENLVVQPEDNLSSMEKQPMH